MPSYAAICSKGLQTHKVNDNHSDSLVSNQSQQLSWMPSYAALSNEVLQTRMVNENYSDSLSASNVSIAIWFFFVYMGSSY